MIAFSIGNIHIYWYGIFYAVTFLLGYYFLNFLGKSFSDNNHQHKIFSNFPKIQNILTNPENLILYILIGVLVGGRIGYFGRWGNNFFDSLVQLPQIRNGGMAFLGGAVGVVLMIYIFSKKNKLTSKEFLILIDIILLIVPIGIMLGRIGNHLNQEIKGLEVSQVSPAIANIFSSFGLVDNGMLNVALAGSVLEGGLIAIILHLVFWTSYRKNIKPGLISGIFLVLYGLARLFLEPLKQYSYTSSGKFGLSEGILLSIIFLGFYLIYASYIGNKHFLKRD